MKEYKDLYSFEVLDAIAEGRAVEMVDREEHIVYTCSDMKADALIRAVNCKDKGRFRFWSVEECKKVVEVAEESEAVNEQ